MLEEKLKQLGGNAFCSVAVFLKEGKILVGLRCYTYNEKKTISVWTCPGGKCNEGERVEQALRREVKEETGITDFTIEEYIGEVPGVSSREYTAVLFLCSTKQDPELKEPHKFSEWIWHELGEYKHGVFPKHFPFINEPSRKVIVEFLSRRAL